MIDILRIKNFQRHRDLVVDFSPNITTIVGGTDAGKSAVLRALRWISTNKPSGIEFIRRGAKKAEVVLGIGDHQVRRVRSKSDNTYHLDSNEFKAFGADIPEDVARFLNMNEVNFQSQHDPPFWFSESPGQVSRNLNSIIDLEVMDDTMSAATSRVRKANGELDVLKGQYAEARAEIKALAEVKEQTKDFNGVEKFWNQSERLEQKRDSLYSSITVAEQSEHQAFKLEEELTDLCVVLKRAEEREELNKNIAQLEKLIASITSLKEDMRIEIPDLTELEDAWNEMEDINRKVELLHNKIDEITNLEETICQLNEDVESTEETFRQQIGKKCALCNAKIK